MRFNAACTAKQLSDTMLTKISASLVTGFPLPSREKVTVILHLSNRRHGVKVRKNRQPSLGRDIARI